MARARSPNRDKAFELWKESNGTILLKEIASQLGVTDSQIRKWKNHDKWEELIKSNVTKSKGNVTNKKALLKAIRMLKVKAHLSKIKMQLRMASSLNTYRKNH